MKLLYSANYYFSDDCQDSTNVVDEYVRMTIDCMCISKRPRKGFTKPLRCLKNTTPSFDDIVVTVLNFQIDNQMFRKGLYDFPAIVSGQQQSGLHKFKFNSCVASDLMLEMLKENSLVTLSLTFDTNTTDGKVLKSIHTRINPLHVFIEDTFIYKLNSILSSFESTSNQGRGIKRVYYSSLPSDVSISSQNLSKHLHLDALKVEEISVLVNVHASMKMYIGLDQSPLHFSMFNRTNVVTTSYALGMKIRPYFTGGIILFLKWCLVKD